MGQDVGGDGAGQGLAGQEDGFIGGLEGSTPAGPLAGGGRGGGGDIMRSDVQPSAKRDPVLLLPSVRLAP